MRPGMIALLVTLVVTGCSYAPDAQEVGKDVCTHCNMVVSDPKFGGQLVTSTGKKMKFDSAECLAAYVNGGLGSTTIRSLWVIDYRHPGQWIEADRAVFLKSEHIPSPMGMYISAFANQEDLSQVSKELDGSMLNWVEVRNLVAETWSRKGR